MCLDFRQPTLLVTELTFDTERVNDLSDDPRGTSNADVFVTHWAVLIQNEPVLDASFAE